MKMRQLVLVVLGLTSAFGPTASAGQATGETDQSITAITALSSDEDRISYAVGMAFARSLKQKEIAVLNFDVVMKGVYDTYQDKTSALSETEFQKVYAVFQKRVTVNLDKIRDHVANENLVAGKEFLTKNAKNAEVTVLPDGLQYKIIKKGDGAKPGPKDKVAVLYRGALINSVEFENTLANANPTTIEMEEMIPAWREALQLMPVGSRWQIFVPAELGYGVRGAGTVIPPNAATMFEIELVDIVKR
jgi:FKBP-type peptidyl-prolyl cis-trans isomerase